MTFTEAAIKILNENSNQPLSSREIWNKISEQNLIKSNGKTPWATLNTALLYHSKLEYNKTILFDIVSNNPMKFIISDINKQKDIIVDVEIETSEKTLLYSTTSKELDWKKLTVYNNNENIEYELSDCLEYTYMIQDKAHSTIKIGKTKNNPEIRFNQLRTANPSIQLLHVFTSDQWSESGLHDKFNDFKKDLEWYFNVNILKNFTKEEINKHNKIIESFNIKNTLNKYEEEMLNII